MNVGEVSGVAVNSKGDVAIFTRSNSAGGPAYGATASQVLLFDKTGKFLREVGKGLYAWSYAHAIRFDKDDNLWAIDKGSDMIVRINPEGHVTMVFGRKKEASDDAEPWKRVNAAAAAGQRPVPPADRRRVGHRGQHLHQRRLHQLARREVHEGRRLGDVDRRAGRHQDRRAEHAAHHRQRRQGQHLRRRPRQPPHPGDRSEDQHVRARDQDRRAGAARREAVDGRRRRRAEARAPGRRAARRGRSASRRPTRSGTQFLYSSDAFPGRVYKLSLDGKVLGMARQVRPSGEAVRLDSRDRLPERERDLRRASCSTGGCRS